MTSPSNPKEIKGKSGESESSTKKRGWDEIESIFDEKKKELKQCSCSKSKTQSVPVSHRKKSNVSKGNDGIVPKNRSEYHGNLGEWVDDGLGGKYNAEGFTGRVEDGMKIFKAHVLSKPNAGQTSACPFDCDCCYI